MLNESCEKTSLQSTSDRPLLKYVSWSAIVSGALIAVGLSFLLNLFNIAIGLSIVVSKEGAEALALGGLIGLIITSIIPMFLGGAVAGYLGCLHYTKPVLGVIYGFVAWCLALVITLSLAESVTSYVSNFSTLITHPTSTITIQDKNVSVVNPVINQLNSESDTVVGNSTQKAVAALSATSFIVFVLFFIGALSSCFGGYFGMVCSSKKE